jgi:hypothetical protein
MNELHRRMPLFQAQGPAKRRVAGLQNLGVEATNQGSMAGDGNG